MKVLLRTQTCVVPLYGSTYCTLRDVCIMADSHSGLYVSVVTYFRTRRGLDLVPTAPRCNARCMAPFMHGPSHRLFESVCIGVRCTWHVGVE